MLSNTLAAKSGLYSIEHLAILSITGKDAASLLQGQITCNVYEVTEQKASLGALCTAKGRVIATFLLAKTELGFLMILPTILLDKVKITLQKYVLRSVVTLTDSSDTLRLFGVSSVSSRVLDGIDAFVVPISSVSQRQLLVISQEKADALVSAYLQQGFQLYSSEDWQYLDTLSGLPWLNMDTSEEFIPQMLNLDKLGGISFNKGCYTGQEIVARTHYLGKSKRALFLATCVTDQAPKANSAIFTDAADNTVVGHVLSAQQIQDHYVVLVVLQTNELQNSSSYRLEDHSPLTLLPFSA